MTGNVSRREGSYRKRTPAGVPAGGEFEAQSTDEAPLTFSEEDFVAVEDDFEDDTISDEEMNAMYVQSVKQDYQAFLDSVEGDERKRVKRMKPVVEAMLDVADSGVAIVGVKRGEGMFGKNVEGDEHYRFLYTCQDDNYLEERTTDDLSDPRLFDFQRERLRKLDREMSDFEDFMLESGKPRDIERFFDRIYVASFG